jgi:hypothetical protein
MRVSEKERPCHRRCDGDPVHGEELDPGDDVVTARPRDRCTTQ